MTTSLNMTCTNWCPIFATGCHQTGRSAALSALTHMSISRPFFFFTKVQTSPYPNRWKFLPYYWEEKEQRLWYRRNGQLLYHSGHTCAKDTRKPMLDLGFLLHWIRLRCEWDQSQRVSDQGRGNRILGLAEPRLQMQKKKKKNWHYRVMYPFDVKERI